MSEEEIIKIIKEKIILDFNCYNPIDKIELEAIQGILDLYNKEKEKNKELEERLAEIEKKDKIIDLMANDFWHEHYLYFMEIEKLDNKDELIKYFTKQVEKRN